MTDFLHEKEIDKMMERILLRFAGEIHKLYEIELEFDKAKTIKERINEAIIEMKRENLLLLKIERKE